jgi:hypothetical protein
MSSENDPMGDQIEKAVESGNYLAVEKLVTSREREQWIIDCTTREARASATARKWSVWKILRSLFMIRSVTKDRFAMAQAEIVELRKRIEELELRVGAMKQTSVEYRGVFRQESAPYRPGELVTHGGNLFHCWKYTLDRPGTSDSWQMMTKVPR